MTPARAKALRLVEECKVTVFEGKWYEEGYWQPLNSRPYTWAHEQGLIRIDAHAGIGYSSKVRLTQKGRDVRSGKVVL